MNKEDIELFKKETKTSLELIWETKSHGWAKRMKKNVSKFKPYTIRMTPILHTYLDSETMTVFAENKDDANELAKQEIRAKYPNTTIHAFRYY